MAEKWTDIKKGLEGKQFFQSEEIEFLEALAVATSTGRLNTANIDADRQTLFDLEAGFASKLSPARIRILFQLFYDAFNIPLRVTAGDYSGITLPEYLHARDALDLILNNNAAFANWRHIIEATRTS